MHLHSILGPLNSFFFGTGLHFLVCQLTKNSNVRGMSSIDLTPADMTVTGVRPNSVKSALMSKPKMRSKCSLELQKYKQITHQGGHFMKLVITDNLSFTDKYTHILDFDWLWSTVIDCCHGNSQWMTNCQWWQVSWKAPQDRISYNFTIFFLKPEWLSYGEVEGKIICLPKFFLWLVKVYKFMQYGPGTQT